jgi:hypothetical protein
MNERQWWIYVIAPQTGYPCKIGYASNLGHRLGALQVGCWEKLEIHRKVPVFSKSAAIGMERMIHKHLDKHGGIREGQRIRGEWFDIFAEDAYKIIEEAFDYQKRLQALKEKENWDDEKSSFYGYIELSGV